jgi:hypothetical protein
VKLRTDLLNAIVVMLAYWVGKTAKGKQKPKETK